MTSPSSDPHKDSAAVRPTTSVIVMDAEDDASLHETLTGLASMASQVEVIVSLGQNDARRATLEEQFPWASLAVSDTTDPEGRRSQALRMAGGDIVRFIQPADSTETAWLEEVTPKAGDLHPNGNGRSEWNEYFTHDHVAPQGRTVKQLSEGDHIVIIGGGPGGLTAGYLLAKDGYKVTVLEGTDMLGGISQTAQYKGYRFDIGGHRFFTKYPPVQAMWEEVLGDEFISVPRLSRIFYNGKFFDYPLKPWNALSGLGIINAVLIVLSYLKAHFFPNPEEKSFDQWVSNRFGKRLYSIFFKTYTEKVWGIPCTEIQAEWAAQRIQGLSLAAAILQAASLTKRPSKIKTLINEFKYPRLGPGQMWEICADRIREMGGEVLMHHHVRHLEVEDGEGVAVVADTPDGERRFAGDHFFSTMPVRSLVRALSPQPETPIIEAAEGLRYRDFLVVALIVDQKDLFPDNWIYIHSPDVKVGRIQNFNNWSQAMVPEEGRTCIGMEYFCFKGDGLWTTTDEELVALARKELAQLGLADASLVVDGAVIRMPKAYPIYDGDYRDHLDVVRSHIDAISNLHPVGRNGMHKYNNQDHSMLTSMMSVWNMQGARHDVWAVNTDFEYHEEMKIPESESSPAPASTTAA